MKISFVLLLLSLPGQTPGPSANDEEALGAADAEGWIEADDVAPLDEEAAPLVVDAGETRVEVRAPRAAASEVVLGREELAVQNARSAEDFLRRVPGAFVVQHGAEGKGPQLFLRGFDAVHGADVELRLHGVPLNEPSHVHGQGYLDLAFIIPETVEAVTVQKGSFDVGQGPFANAGTARLEVGAPAPGALTKIELGTPGRARLVASLAPRRPSGERPGAFVAVEALRDGGFGRARRAERLSLNGLWEARFLEGDPLFPTGVDVKAGIFLYGGRFGLPGALRLDDVHRGERDFYDAYFAGEGTSLRTLAFAGAKTRLLGVTAEARAFAGLRHLALDESFTGYLEDPDLGDARRQAQTSGDAGATLELRRALFPGLVGVLTAEGRETLGHQTVSALDARRDLVRVDTSRAFSATSFGASGGLLYTAGDWLRLTGGIRAESFYVSALDEKRMPMLGQEPALGAESPLGLEHFGAALLPRVTASVKPLPFGPLDGIRLFGAAGRGVRPPEASPVTVVDEDGEVRGPLLFPTVLAVGGVTVAENAELGVVWESPARRYELSASTFGVLVMNEVLFNHVAGTTELTGASRRLGAELRVDARPVPWLTVGADVTAVHARYLTADGEQSPGDGSLLPETAGSLLFGEAWVPGVAPLMASGRLTLEPFPWLTVGGRTLLLSARPLRFGAAAPPVAVVDAFADARWRFLALGLEVDNVLDARYAEGASTFGSWWDKSQPRSALPATHVFAGTPRLIRLSLAITF